MISGGGAVGMFLGIRLQQLGFDCLIIEQKTERSTHSRSIGIHPPSLEYLQEMGIVEPFIEQGCRVPKGLAIGDHGLIGELNFADLRPPFPFILTLPQYQTETILENYLMNHFPDSLLKGVKLIDLNNKNHEVIAKVESQKDVEEIRCHFLVGCDGKNSTVRQLLNIDFKGEAYPDSFIMGDFEDTTPFGSSAAIYLQSEGLIESFPLPGNKRRWVIRTPEYIPSPSVEQLADNIEPRTGFLLDPDTNTMISSFGVQHYIASSFGKKRAGIIGDAAHIVSPFGGQGMNLGWMDAWKLSEILHKQSNANLEDFPWKSFTINRRLAAWQAIKRAEFNMAMGRKHQFPVINEFFTKSLLYLPTKWILPRLFTMRWL